MNRETWFQILQIAVLAPYVYTLSDEETNSYFRLGLKLIAGAIVIKNIPPLLNTMQPLIAAAAQMQASADRIAEMKKSEAIDGEFVESKSRA